jgi:hypothetical protein
MPLLEGRSLFKGEAIRSHTFETPSKFQGKDSRRTGHG